MPTTDIIGYLWTKRQALSLDGIPDALQMASDLERGGLSVVRVEETKIFGVPTGTSVALVRREPEEWDELVSDAIVKAHARNMIDRAGDLR